MQIGRKAQGADKEGRKATAVGIVPTATNECDPTNNRKKKESGTARSQ